MASALKYITCVCCRIGRSGRKTVCFRSTRVQSGTPTVFSLCSGKIHVLQYYTAATLTDKECSIVCWIHANPPTQIDLLFSLFIFSFHFCHMKRFFSYSVFHFSLWYTYSSRWRHREAKVLSLWDKCMIRIKVLGAMGEKTCAIQVYTTGRSQAIFRKEIPAVHF